MGFSGDVKGEMVALCAISLLTSGYGAAAAVRMATPETLTSVVDSARQLSRAEDVEIVLSPGVYDLEKIFPKQARESGEDVYLGFRPGAGRRLRVTGGAPGKVGLYSDKWRREGL